MRMRPRPVKEADIRAQDVLVEADVGDEVDHAAGAGVALEDVHGQPVLGQKRRRREPGRSGADHGGAQPGFGRGREMGQDLQPLGAADDLGLHRRDADRAVHGRLGAGLHAVLVGADGAAHAAEGIGAQDQRRGAGDSRRGRRRARP